MNFSKQTLLQNLSLAWPMTCNALLMQSVIIIDLLLMTFVLGIIKLSITINGAKAFAHTTESKTGCGLRTFTLLLFFQRTQISFVLT